MTLIQTRSYDTQDCTKTNMQYSAKEVVYGEMRAFWDAK